MEFSTPVVMTLCETVALAIFTVPAPPEGPLTLSGSFGEALTPLSTLRLAETDGSSRLIFAFPRPRIDSMTLMIAAEGMPPIPVEWRSDAPAISQKLFEGLVPAARQSLASALLGSWAGLFKLSRSTSFIQTLRTLFTAPEGPAGQGTSLLGADDLQLVETPLSPQLGQPKGGFAVSARRLEPVRISVIGRQGGERVRRLFVAGMEERGEALLVLRFAQGFAIRKWTIAAKPPTLESWWKAGGAKDFALRQDIVSRFNAHSAATAAAALEFQLRCPLRPAAVKGAPSLPSAQIDLALSGKKGMLVGGWFRDQGGFIDGFDVLGPDETPISLDDARFDFNGRVAQGEGAVPATGFVSFVPQLAGPLLQPRFLMRLKSGVRHVLVPPPQPADWTEARAAALRAVPPQALNDRLISSCLAPLVEEYQEAAKASVGAPVVQQIGTPIDNPLVSIVIPLYKVLDFLPFQIAAFASDPQVLFRCELIFVLDSPEQADVVEHMLTGLHLVYGIPITLAVMPRNGGYAIANNRAAALARGEGLILLNSDVIPIEAGWVGTLVSRFADQSIGAVGPKLLFEDDSIQHAGLYFDPDHRGRWLNHHFHKGMPRHYRPANEERLVPGVTGACLVTRRALFERVGGFTEDYVIGDYEDSDLCLKLRATGSEIAYVPEAELYHLERRSMRQSGDYMRGVASQYNSWLHQQRWGDAMAALMAQPEKKNPLRRVA